MTGLLNIALEAHGGLERWNMVQGVHAKAEMGGVIWAVKSRPDVLKIVELEAATKIERLTMLFPGQHKQTIFEGSAVTINKDGESPEIWKNPVTTFEGHTLETPWQDVHVAYFSGEAMWTYLNIPFLFTYPGVVTEEIEPWQEDGETWRRLKITFPDTIITHSKEQVAFFGPDGLVRRHDYAVNVLGGSTGARYCSNYQNVDGILIPASHKVYGYQGDHVVQKEPVLVAIELSVLSLVR